MEEFKPITTQEQLDAVIGERLKRERETVEKKYTDYNDLKSKVSAHEKTIAEMTSAAEESAKKLKGYETASVKTRIAHELKIPYEMAERLRGETEEDIRKDAETLAKYISKGEPPAPGKSTEPAGQGESDTKGALRNLARDLTSKE